jgi:hypothetical protein
MSWDAGKVGSDVLLEQDNTVATCNKPNGSGMSGAIGKDSFDPSQQESHTCTFEILKATEWMALGVAESTVRAEGFTTGGEHMVVRSSGQVHVRGVNVPCREESRLIDGDILRIDINFSSGAIWFRKNGIELCKSDIAKDRILYPYIASCLGASVRIQQADCPPTPARAHIQADPQSPPWTPICLNRIC